MFRSAKAALAVLPVALAAPAMAQGTVEELSAPAPVDFADVRQENRCTDRRNQSQAERPTLLRAALGENPVGWRGKTSQISLVVSQYETVSAEYGKAEQCVGWKQDYTSSLRIMDQLYLPAP